MSNQTPGPLPGTQAGSSPVLLSDPPPVFLSVVRGNPTDTELAALVTVLAARAGAAAAAAAAPATSAAGQPTPARAPRSRWSDKSWLMRASLSPGPDAWRRSALPR
jgi:Acyl-CoA carboxylase epsilon subunit